jgi:hypothetical protein
MLQNHRALSETSPFQEEVSRGAASTPINLDKI